MKNTLVLLSLFFLFGCKEKTEKTTQSKSKNTIQQIEKKPAVDAVIEKEWETSNQKIYKGEIDGDQVTINSCFSTFGNQREEDFWFKTEKNPNYTYLYTLSKIADRNFLLAEKYSLYERSKSKVDYNQKNENKRYWHIRRNNNSLIGKRVGVNHIPGNPEGQAVIKLKRIWHPAKTDLLGEN